MIPSNRTLFLTTRAIALLAALAAASCGDEPRGGPGDPVAKLPLAAGVTIAAVDWFQGVQIPIMADGEAVLDADVPVVGGKDAVVRIFVDVEEGFSARELWGRVELSDASGMQHFEETAEVSVDSSAAAITSTLNVSIPGSAIEAGQSIVVSVRETSEGASGSGAGDGAQWPESGGFELGTTEVMPPVKIVLVPVEYNADGSGRLPDMSDDQLQRYEDFFNGMYPVTGVDLVVDDPMPYAQAVSPMNGNSWSALLNAVTQRRTDNGAGTGEFYYGLVSPADTFGEFCGGGCITGMSWLAAGPGGQQVGTGIGFNGFDAAWTAVHEVGHAFGLAHAPCGGAAQPDPGFPYSGGGIGVMGYDVTKGYDEGPLKDPATYKDMMGYCPGNQWISDYFFDKLYTRVEAVAQYYDVHPGVGAEPWRSVVLMPDGTVVAGPGIAGGVAGGGETRRVLLRGADGAIVGEVDGAFTPYADFPGGLVAFPPPAAEAVTAELLGYPAVALP